MGRVLTISILLVSIHAVPALCVSGMITHACECDSDHSLISDAGCDHETDCRHEGECPDDPCSIRLIRAERSTDNVITMSLTAAVSILDVAAQPSTQIVRTSAHAWFEYKNLRFPVSDLPLLI
jgi:hypothetical protein